MKNCQPRDENTSHWNEDAVGEIPSGCNDQIFRKFVGIWAMDNPMDNCWWINHESFVIEGFWWGHMKLPTVTNKTRRVMVVATPMFGTSGWYDEVQHNRCVTRWRPYLPIVQTQYNPTFDHLRVAFQVIDVKIHTMECTSNLYVQ